MDILCASPRLRPDIVIRSEQDGCLLYNPATDHLHLVPGGALEFMRRFDGARSVEELIRDMIAPYAGEESERVKWLALLFIRDLMDRKLIEA